MANQPIVRGLKAGDVIVEYNGRPVKDSDVLVGMVVNTKPGSSVPVTVIRDKQRKTVNVTVAELNLDAEQGRLTTRRNQPDEEQASTGLGMDIETVTPEIAREMDLPRDRGSVIVTHVERNSAAAAGGVAQSDIILEVNRTPVTSVSQVTRELQKVPAGGTVTLLVWRNGTGEFPDSQEAVRPFDRLRAGAFRDRRGHNEIADGARPVSDFVF